MRSSMQSTPARQVGFDRDRRGLQIVPALAVGRLAEIVPRAIDRGGAHVAAAGSRASPCGRRWGSGSTISPIPDTWARPPTRQNGMSAPSRPARSSSDRLVPKPPHRSAVAASVDPPPSPPPCGMRLSIVVTAARSGEVERPRDEVRAVGRDPVGERTDRRQRRLGRWIARLERQQVVQFEAHHLGIDEVVAVVTHAGDVQRQRQLGVGPPRAHGVPAGAVATASARRHQREHVEFLRARGGRDAGRRELLGGDDAVERAAQHLAPLAEPGAHQREQDGRVGRRCECAARSRRATTRRSVAARTPTPGRCRRCAPWPSTRPSRSPRRTPACAGSPRIVPPPPVAPSRSSGGSAGRRRAGRRRAASPRCRAGWRRAPTPDRQLDRRPGRAGRSSRHPSRRPRPR